MPDDELDNLPAVHVSDEEAARYSGYPVRLYCFSGPLDLLLHLVRVQQVDIAEVMVAEVTAQYLEYLRTMQEISLEISGEFLVTAAALTYVKSRSLLPPEPEAEKEEELPEDPAVELQRRLAQYHIYKEAAEHLQSARQVRERIFLRPLEEGTGLEAGYVALRDVSLFDMVGAVNQLLQRAQPEPTGKVHLPPLTVPDRMEEILLRLAAEPGEVSFAEVVGEPVTRTRIIITFLALLELIRREQVEVRQDQALGDILVRQMSVERKAELAAQTAAEEASRPEQAPAVAPEQDRPVEA